MEINALFSIVLLASVSFAASDSCSGRCDASLNANYNCQCNTACSRYGDCCSDYWALCDSSSSCSGRTTCDYNYALSCQCNSLCGSYGNCCPDYEQYCGSGAGSTGDTCTGRCGTSLDASKTCQCNPECLQYGDCCDDYSETCDGTDPGTGTDGCSAISISNSDLKTVSLEMWNLDVNSFPYGEVTYNIQGSTTTSATNDVAPDLFFTYVNEALLQGDTFQKLMALQDNYIRTQGYTEDVTDEELQENEAFLDAFLATDVGARLYQFLDSYNLAGCTGVDGFKTILNDIWFGMYDRKAPDDTSGFEHAFVGEIKGTGVSGFHNWVMFYYEEQAGNFNYQGYVSAQEPRMVGMRHTWYGATKPMNGFTIGTSPEIEFALYTLCHLARPGSRCYIQMADEHGNPLDREIQTYTWSNEAAPNGQSYIASAYFLS